MSKQAQAFAKPVGAEPAQACRGYDPAQFEAAFVRLSDRHPAWSHVRLRQRAWIAMFKRESGAHE